MTPLNTKEGSQNCMQRIGNSFASLFRRPHRAISVSLEDPYTHFPNFPNICEVVQRMATEMGIQRNIHIAQDLYLHVVDGDYSTASNFATIGVPEDFPKSGMPPQDGHWPPVEFCLRHELAHIYYNW